MTERLLEAPPVRAHDQTFIKLSFLFSAYNTAQRMIWFSDQKASFIVIYYGILLSMLGTRVERLGTFLRAPNPSVGTRLGLVVLGLVFLATMIVGLAYALRTVIPTYAPKVNVADYKRLYWCDDILAKDIDTYFASLNALDGDGLLKEMTRELYAAVGIERAKFSRVALSLKSAVGSFVAWVIIFICTFFL